uniref:Uncharacterized protein n=1 Tax=Glossina palpalis gambiensis TaxID=67801 RepID=A0A1B0BJ13_9MUSC
MKKSSTAAEDSLIGYRWSYKLIVTGTSIGSSVGSALLSGFIKFKHGEALSNTSHLAYAYDYLTTALEYEFILVVIVVESSRGCGGNGIDKLNSENSNSIQTLAKTSKHYSTSNSKPKGRQCAKRLKLIDMRICIWATLAAVIQTFIQH